GPACCCIRGRSDEVTRRVSHVGWAVPTISKRNVKTESHARVMVGIATLLSERQLVKLWYHKIDESRRRVLEVSAQQETTIGRAAGSTLVLPRPLVSRRCAVVRRGGAAFELESIGLKSCVLGDAGVLVCQRMRFAAGAPLRIWPYTISIE